MQKIRHMKGIKGNKCYGIKFGNPNIHTVRKQLILKLDLKSKEFEKASLIEIILRNPTG